MHAKNASYLMINDTGASQSNCLCSILLPGLHFRKYYNMLQCNNRQYQYWTAEGKLRAPVLKHVHTIPALPTSSHYKKLRAVARSYLVTSDHISQHAPCLGVNIKMV